ncbi:efflux RND transporter permease subunit [Evansella cellulosilytica]|uniref:Acriflavin resistance protein n=1 Tax=Evansella cellulosilytica (strain ATCC 21833 / DSM 2522 / FERM P-1141 / JCM 9156 / N-4) TaxID=649639 RepID=E6TZZ9_EVAC2|nr:efflux RND transporter permease subunit [Evansella cellulosilytica]ADU29003.1 acriflavin resistance protein [Evansella cellulosilytica DSM 2522]
MNITKFSIKRPIFTIVTMILFLLLGAISLTNIPLKLMPDIDPPIGAVVTSYQNAGPEEVLDKVSKPLESNLSTVPGLNNISSISMEGASMTILEFSWATSIDDVENEIISRMNQVPLPDGAGSPNFLRFDPSQLPIIQLSISSDEEDFDEIAEDLGMELSRIEGIASVDITGQAIDEIIVELDQYALEDYGLDQSDVISMIQAHNVTTPGGMVQSGDLEYTTRVLFELTTLEDIENIVLTVDMATGDEVALSDVATVEIAPENIGAITRTNQDPAIMMSVQQESEANLVQVSTAFNERLDELLDENKYSDLEIAVLFDQGEYVQEAISSVSTALILGGLFAILVLFAFLRSFKTPFIIGIAIPFSVIVTFVLLYFTDLSLNIMTLGGLALGIGMLVDNSIVVIENIYRHLSMKKDPKTAALDGTKQVGGAITASTLTTISVFLPVVFISGIVGDIFMEFALTVSFSLLASLAVALTVVPMVASRILKTPKENLEEKRQASSFIKGISKMIKWSLKHRFAVLTITFLLLVAGAFGISQVGTEFIPDTDEGFFQIDIEMERGTPLEETLASVESIEEVLDDEREILNYMSTVGSGGGPEAALFGGSGSHEASIFIAMVPLAERNISTIEFADSIRRDIERAAPDAEVSVQQQAMMGGAPNTIEFRMTDTDPTRLEEVAFEVVEEFEDMREFNEVTSDITDTVIEIQFLVDDEAARENGFVPAQIAQMINQKMNGAVATQIVTEQNDIYEVHVRYNEEFTRTIEDVEDLLLRNQTGEYVALSEVVEIVEGEGPVTINRINQESSVQFTLQYGSQYSLGEMSQLVQSTIDDMDIPTETTVTYTGDQQMMEDAMSDLTLALMLALVFVYLVLAAQFESFKYPFVIMLSVPLVIIGVMLGLTITLTPLSVMAFIGLIVLAGIVVNNAIVLVDYINKMKDSGMRSYDAIVEGVKDRARPILMTSVTTILGLVPLALGLGEGAEIQQPMAITVIGGLISSTFLTLIFIPVMYSFFDKQTRNLNRKYVTPDGQFIPAYLIDEKISNQEKKERYELPVEEERKVLEEGDISEFYHPEPSERKYEDDIEYEESSEDDPIEQPFMYHDENPASKQGNEDKRRSSISREELIDILEDVLDREKRNNDEEDNK